MDIGWDVPEITLRVFAWLEKILDVAVSDSAITDNAVTFNDPALRQYLNYV